MKKDWFPFKNMTVEIFFRGSQKWTRGQILGWSKYRFKFLANTRRRPMDYMREEMEGLAIVRNGDQENEGSTK